MLQVVEFGTSDHECLVDKIVLVEVGRRVGDAVRADEQICALQERGARRDQIQENGPLREARWPIGGVPTGPGLRFEALDGRTGTRAARGLRLLLLRLRRHTGEVSINGRLVVRGPLTLLDGDRIPRALSDAVAQPVAVGFADELRLPVDDLNGALVARRGAQAAAIALLLVYHDQFPYGHVTPVVVPPFAAGGSAHARCQNSRPPRTRTARRTRCAHSDSAPRRTSLTTVRFADSFSPHPGTRSRPQPARAPRWSPCGSPPPRTS